MENTQSVGQSVPNGKLLFIPTENSNDSQLKAELYYLNLSVFENRIEVLS